MYCVPSPFPQLRSDAKAHVLPPQDRRLSELVSTSERPNGVAVAVRATVHVSKWIVDEKDRVR